MNVTDFLIVEDELLISEMISDILMDAGHTAIRKVATAEEAIKEIEARKPHIVLTDIGLGAGKSGLELGELLNSKYHIPFIYVTSHSSPEILGKAKHTRPNSYIIKPFKSEDLLVAIEFALFNSGAPNAQVEEGEELIVKEGRAIVKLPYAYIVNYSFVTEVKSGSLLAGGHELPIGRTYQANVSSYFNVK